MYALWFIMMSFQLLQLIVNAMSQAFSVSQLSAYNQEIVDGGTKNRIWSFLTTYSLANLTLLPLMLLFPAIDFGLALLGSAFVLGGIFYAASIAQENQMRINQGEFEKIKTLPWGLHKHEYLMKSASFLTLHLATFLLLLYGSSLVACIFLGAPLYAYVSLGMYAIDQLNQEGYLPNVLKAPYLYLGVAVTLLATCGVTSVLGLTLSLGLIAFTAVDYIRCYVWGEDSPTAQFPMTDLSQQIKVPSVEQEDAEATQQFEALLQTHQTHRGDADIHVTFDHFYASHQIVNKLLASAPAIDYKQYIALFNAIDFTHEALRNKIQNEMCVHDKFNGQALSDHCQALNLPSETDVSDVQIAYLKREISYFVERLEQSSYRDFTYQQALTMQRYARLLLSKLETFSNEKKISSLLHLAVTTGSHCNRAYLESLSSLAVEEKLLLVPSLNFREEAMLRVQEAREAAFRTYYHKVAPQLNKRPYFSIIWDDTGDYHTYEDFVYTFGVNFYLMNASFTTGFRDIFEVLNDRVVALYRGVGILFCEHYTVNYLVDQTINPEKKLYKIFERWCAEHQVRLLDEDYMLRFEPNSAELRALAELMLLDFNIIALKKPYKIPAVSRDSFFQPEPLLTDTMVLSSLNDEQNNMNHVNR